MDIDASKVIAIDIDEDRDVAVSAIPAVFDDVRNIQLTARGKGRSRDRSDDRTDEEREAEDAKELFAAALALGQEVEEFDLAHDAYVRVFTRGENWAEALDEIRK